MLYGKQNQRRKVRQSNTTPSTIAFLDDSSYRMASNFPSITSLLNRFQSLILLHAFVLHSQFAEKYLLSSFFCVVNADFAIRSVLYIERIPFSLHPLHVIFACTTAAFTLACFTFMSEINIAHKQNKISL